MKNVIFSAAFILILTIRCFPQSIDLVVSRPDRYQLDLPVEFSSPKMIRTITEILSKTMIELKDRDFCTSCVAGYIVKLQIDSIKTDISTNPGTYNFKAVLRVFDSTNNPVSQLLIVSPKETFEVIVKGNKTTHPIEYTKKDKNLIEELAPMLPGTERDKMTSPAFNNFLSSNIPGYTPLLSSTDLVKICKKKIMELKKMLKKLSESGQL